MMDREGCKFFHLAKLESSRECSFNRLGSLISPRVEASCGIQWMGYDVTLQRNLVFGP
jgi:hypothetical protein